MATFYVVATPIGNLEDVTLRALRILKDVDRILCEDTRVTRRLLSCYEIGTPTLSYHARSGLSKVDKILDLLKEGKNLGLVTDAGTPGISDPGSELVAAIRKELPEVSIVPIPGASALTACVSASGLHTAEFVFLGFLPHKKGRESLFKEIADAKRSIVFYESPHRLMKTLEKLSEVLESRRKIAVGRELTKMFENLRVGSAEDILAHFTENPDQIRGELVLLVEGR